MTSKFSEYPTKVQIGALKKCVASYSHPRLKRASCIAAVSIFHYRNYDKDSLPVRINMMPSQIKYE